MALKVAVICVAVFAVFAYAVSRKPARPGSPAVYAAVDASTDCAELQKMFDTAWANNRRYPAGTRQFDWALGYMNAADGRMHDIGCYG